MKTQEQFLEEVRLSNPKVNIIGEYHGMHTKIPVSCKTCGYKWSLRPDHIIRGIGCPNCCHVNTSIIEQILYLSLSVLLEEDIAVIDTENINTKKVINRDTSIIGKELDIYIPSIQLAIEFGAWVWHKDRLDKDIEKENLCITKEVHLITIYEKCPQKHMEINGLNDVRCYKDNISSEPDYHSIRSFLLGLCQLYNWNTELLNDENWATIISVAQRLASRLTTGEFIKKLSTINPDVSILGEYKGANTKTQVGCNRCGNIWDARPSTLLRGQGCPVCGSKRTGVSLRKTHDEFVAELSKKNDCIEVLGQYTDATTKVEVRCKKCGKVWKPTGGSLLSGRGCPSCKSERIANKLRRTHEEFVAMLQAINPNVEILSKYINKESKVLAKCLVCKHEWNVQAGSLLQGKGCPICAKAKLGHNHKRVICIETGKVYPSISAARTETGIVHIASCVTGKRKSAGGYHWKYAD